jgi:hypothetical protein
MTRDELVDGVALALGGDLGYLRPVGFDRRSRRAAAGLPELANEILSISFWEVAERARTLARREVERAVRFRPPIELSAFRAAKDAHGLEWAQIAEDTERALAGEIAAVMTEPPGGWAEWPAFRHARRVA